MFEFKRKFSDVSVQRMTYNLQTGSRDTFQTTVPSAMREGWAGGWVGWEGGREGERERETERTLRRHVVTVSI